MEFKEGNINGVMVKDLKKLADKRGWLTELFRQDEIEEDILPAMSYISMTLPGITRGPHEHKEQTDCFVFIGSSMFKIVLWDNREDSSTYMNKMVLLAGKETPLCVVVPPKVIHAYKNIGDKNGIVINFPNRLYAGWGRKEPVDEIRYENDPNTIFKVDE